VSLLLLVAATAALVSAVLTAILIIRGPTGFRLKLAGLEARLIDIEQASRSAGEAALHARDAKESTSQLAAAFNESKGRLSSMLEAQGQLVEVVARLQSALPIQIAEGMRDLGETTGALHTALRQESAERDERQGRALAARLDSGFLAMSEAIAQMRTETTGALRESGEALAKGMSDLRGANDYKLAEIVSRTTESANTLNITAHTAVTTITDKLGELRTNVDNSLKTELGAIRTENAEKLEAIRHTVDEKLHATLEQRLGDSFKLVSERLEMVHRGLGEMQVLATGVGDLRKVLTNVKTRGTWGEVQLGNLLDQILTAEQYSKNVATKGGSNARVEFAIRLPGRSDDNAVWLPIDAKFPMEDYQRLVEAQDQADLRAIEATGNALEARIKLEAKSIRDRYIDPPQTTDFAILYLPTEGLYAEVLRRAGLADWTQRECKVVLCGPTTLGAMLNSLQMGFRTLAIERRSSEVWAVLGAVKTEFGKFGEALAHTKKKLEEATSSILTAEQRNRVLTQKLRSVDVLPAPDAATALSVASPGPADLGVDE